MQRAGSQRSMDVEVISSPPATLGADERKLAQLGYRQTFPRILGAFESFATGFNAIAVCSYINVVRLQHDCSMSGCMFVRCTRAQVWYIAMFDGGPKAAVINFLVIGVTAMSTALVLSEICSAMPASGAPAVHCMP
jgi:amino acid transporter